MVEADIGQDGDVAVHDVGGVPGPAEPDLDDHGVEGLGGEPRQRGGGEQLETSAFSSSDSSSASSASTSVNAASSITSPLRARRSVTVCRFGLVYVPTLKPFARSSIVTIADVDPLPLVPVMWSEGIDACGSPSSPVSAHMGSRVGSGTPARHVRLEVDVRVQPGDGVVDALEGRGCGWFHGDRDPIAPVVRLGQDAARRERVALAGAPPSGTSVGRDPVQHDGAVHHALAHVGAARQVVHDVEQHLFEDGAEAAGAGAAQQRLLGDRLEGVRRELELDVVEGEDPLVLLGQGVLRLDEDLHQRFLEQRRHRAHDGQAADELGDQAELDQVLGEHVAQDLAVVAVLAVHLGAEPDAALADAALDQLVQTGERATADEEDVRRVDLDELLVRVLAPALGRHGGRGALEDLEEGLLHALARDVTRDRRVLALAGDLVDLVDVDDPGLGALHVVVRGLDQLQEDVLDVLAHVARLGERRGVGDGERHVEHARQRLGQQRLAAPGRAEQQDVRLRELDAVLLHRRAGLYALVVVVDGDREDLLGVLLPDHVVVEEVEDLAGLGQVLEAQLGGLVTLLGDDVVAQVDALVADVDTRTGDQLLDLLLGLATEAALDEVPALTELGHPTLLPSVRTLSDWSYRLRRRWPRAGRSCGP